MTRDGAKELSHEFRVTSSCLFLSRRSQSFRQGTLNSGNRSQSHTSCNVNSSISAHPLLPIETGWYFSLIFLFILVFYYLHTYFFYFIYLFFFNNYVFNLFLSLYQMTNVYIVCQKDISVFFNFCFLFFLRIKLL